MPDRRREYCPFENDLVDPEEFEMVDGTRLHNVDPLHRVTDGVRVRVENGQVIEIEPVEDVIDAMADE